MAKFNGYPGMGGGASNGMASLLRQAKKMQADMMKTHTEIEEKEFDIATGGGAVTVTMTGKKTLRKIKIKPEVIDKDDPEMLEDLIITAVNEGIKKAEEMMEEEMKKYNIPDGLNRLL